jgi:protein TonB
LLFSILVHVVIGIEIFISVAAAPPSPVEIDLVPSAPIPPSPTQAKMSAEDALQKQVQALPDTIALPARSILRPLVNDSRIAQALLTRPRMPPHADVSDPGASVSETAVSGAVTSSEAPPADPSPPAPVAAPPPDYIALIRGRLEQYKRYPAEARAARQVGTVLLSFTLDRTGQVLDWRIARSSGITALDEEANALIQRASPFPPFPASYARDSIHITIPVEFSLAMR